MQAPDEPLTTVRVSGIPPSVTEAAFNCWFLFAQGFEQATLAPSRGPDLPQAGWARFSSPEEARLAIAHLHGRRLTPEQYPAGAILMAELARRNYRPRAQIVPAPAPGQDWEAAAWQPPAAAAAKATEAAATTLFIWKLQREATEEELAQLCAEQCPGFERLKFVPATEGKAGMCFVKFSTAEAAAAALHILGGYALASNPTEALHIDYARAELDEPKRPTGTWPLPASRGVPCDTMYVGGLAPCSTEEELAYALGTLQGFERLKFLNEGTDKAMAFALFDSPQSCAEAIEALHGNALPSAPTTALTCEFSKNSLGKLPRTV